MYTILLNQDSLMHHGIRGQKWGVRRYQNKDGSLTSQGKKHYDMYNESKRLDSVVSKNAEKAWDLGNKFINSDKQVKKDLVSMDNIDNWDSLSMFAQEYSSTNKYAKELDKVMDDFYLSRKTYNQFIKENKDSIRIGKKISDKLFD